MTAIIVESINELFIEISKNYTNATEIQIKGDDDGQEQAEEKIDNVKLSKDKSNEKRKKRRGFC